MLKSFIKIGTLKIIDAHGKVSVFSGKGGKTVTIKLHNKEVERKLLWQPEMALGEAYMEGTLTIEEGNLVDLLDCCTQNLKIAERTPGILPKLITYFSSCLNFIQQYTPISRAHRNVAHHYDMNDDFTKLFLDEDRQYSCAYFKSKEDSLETAQLNKKWHIANKLLLKPGQRVLDIGCGWGGMALFLAKNFDVDVVGLTLSKEQFAVAEERAKKAQLSNRVKFYLRDYREEKGSFDRIVSVGMFEHVGVPQFQTFFDTAYHLLTDEGVMLLHSIGSSGLPRTTNAWIQKYIFPGGYCPSLSEVVPSVEKAKLNITDIEILRFHYAETLRHWRERFMKNRDKAKQLYDERFCRMWEYYLVSCEMGFRNQDLMVFQMQLSRKKDSVPLTRDYLYDVNNFNHNKENPELFNRDIVEELLS